MSDGSELKDTPKRPAKMRALVSSSALAVNFFDAWRDTDKSVLSEALDLPSAISTLTFEYKTRSYPVRPRSPNLDLMMRLRNSRHVAVESKFSEPYCSSNGYGLLSAKYFPTTAKLWEHAGLPSVQRVAETLRPEWIHLDVPQLVKHLLGLAADPSKPAMLIYLWFDTAKPDALAHRREVERFSAAVAGSPVEFLAITYQEVFARLKPSVEPVPEWYSYMDGRYFQTSGLTA
ncbi:MAG TPA: hypothetical protein VJM31_15325 [Vicinamibacterales bacterium]|nr:hypothetical protein [Vicinamibacterales bacterium]